MANKGKLRQNCRLILDRINYLCVTDKISPDKKNEILKEIKKTLKDNDQERLINYLKQEENGLFNEIIKLI